jgi:hypothetical protein
MLIPFKSLKSLQIHENIDIIFIILLRIGSSSEKYLNYSSFVAFKTIVWKMAPMLSDKSI